MKKSNATAFLPVQKGQEEGKDKSRDQGKGKSTSKGRTPDRTDRTERSGKQKRTGVSVVASGRNKEKIKVDKVYDTLARNGKEVVVQVKRNFSYLYIMPAAILIFFLIFARLKPRR